MNSKKLMKIFTDVVEEICSKEFEQIKGEAFLGEEYKCVEGRINEELNKILPKWLRLVDTSGLSPALMSIEIEMGHGPTGRPSLNMKPSTELNLFIKRLGEQE